MNEVLAIEKQIEIGIVLENQLHLCSEGIDIIRSLIDLNENEIQWELMSPELVSEIKMNSDYVLKKTVAFYNQLENLADKIKNLELTIEDSMSIDYILKDLKCCIDVVTDKCLDLWNE